jgi:DNA-binding MarR family transcriptional regulator
VSTPDLNTLNAQPQFASITDLAAMLNVDKAAVSRKAARLEAKGLLKSQSAGPGRPKMIEVAAYLAATEQTTDAIRAANGALARAEPDRAADPSLAQAQTRRALIQADLAQIELDKARGLLVAVEDVRDAAAHAGGELARGLSALSARAAEIAAAVARDGEAGARAVLKSIERELRERLASDMSLLAAGPAQDADE